MADPPTRDKEAIQETLSLCSEDELKAELERREHAKKVKRAEERKLLNHAIYRHRNELLALIPHSRRSCKEGGTENAAFHHEHGEVRCVRCLLYNWDYEAQFDDVEMSVDIRMRMMSPEELP